jgi:hypothetical protein
MSDKIFISYRRGDDSGSTGRLFDILESEFPKDRLFLDVDNIEPGFDFIEVVEDRIAESEILLAVIGSRWLIASKADGSRRLDDPGDFVRLEIKAALDQNKRVIPVLIGGAQMPSADELPDGLKALATRNAVRITHERFRADAQGLIKAISRSIRHPLEVPAPVRPPSQAADKSKRLEHSGPSNLERTPGQSVLESSTGAAILGVLSGISSAAAVAMLEPPLGLRGANMVDSIAPIAPAAILAVALFSRLRSIVDLSAAAGLSTVSLLLLCWFGGHQIAVLATWGVVLVGPHLPKGTPPIPIGMFIGSFIATWALLVLARKVNAVAPLSVRAACRMVPLAAGMACCSAAAMIDPPKAPGYFGMPLAPLAVSLAILLPWHTLLLANSARLVRADAPAMTLRQIVFAAVVSGCLIAGLTLGSIAEIVNLMGERPNALAIDDVILSQTEQGETARLTILFRARREQRVPSSCEVQVRSKGSIYGGNMPEIPASKVVAGDVVVELPLSQTGPTYDVRLSCDGPASGSYTTPWQSLAPRA